MGPILPYFGNVHMNIMPIVIAAVLTFPGDLIVDNIFRDPVLYTFAAILINAGVWYLIRKMFLLD